MAVLIETSLGDITVDLFTEERPRSTLNFLKLCKIKYYNFCLFHSVQRNLVAQTGDPTGTGRGGQSIFAHLYGDQAVYFDMETVPRIKHRRRGLVSMVNNGNNGHGSQFFITLGEELDYLDGVHTVIGEVGEGLDVLDKINEAYCDEKHRPYKDIRIYHTIVLDDPYTDPDGLVIPDRSPEPTKEQLDSGRIGAEEDIDDTKGMTEAEIQESLEKKEAQANAQILEMVGDLPDADVRPPDTVLFVCKLNPVTTSEDLEIIFSRFGKILSCEVIKDQTSGESLQYAFVEFEKPEDCESAYFKMDNVLIDDRRIHVDFSQSVSKLKFDGGKGKPGASIFGSNYAIKDNTRKDSKYDLVFEEKAESGYRKKSNSNRKDSKRSKQRSTSRSRDRSPVAQRQRRESRSPVNQRKKKENDSSDEDHYTRLGRNEGKKVTKDNDHVRQRYKGDKSGSDSDDGKRSNQSRDRYRQETTGKKVSRRHYSSESDSEVDIRRKKMTDAENRYPGKDTSRKDDKNRSEGKDKSSSHRKKSDSGTSDDGSPERKRRKKKTRKPDNQSDDNSDDGSKVRRKKVKSKHGKDRDSDNDSDYDKSRKKKSTKEYSRERIREDKSNRDSFHENRNDRKDKSKHSNDRRERSRDEHHSGKDRNEKRHRDRR
ncbi:peptidyl-prolyl cis-trans isomerase-like 4 [Liolophura sinensis]|uniref:peptidyl-prolyl cis-trans isomerase-like 4 n=1 Tax=Liolophura sinensis TaxID=3198878 RepID=UPI00315971C4